MSVDGHFVIFSVILKAIFVYQEPINHLATLYIYNHPMIIVTKDCNIKKETNLEAYISVNFLQILTKSAPQMMQIFPAFQRDAL